VQGKTASVEITFDRLPEVRRGPTILPGAYPTTQDGPAGEPLDFSHIAAFEIWLPGPTKTHAMVIDNVRLLPRPDMKGIVDRYGQYSRVDWPGKVHEDADFAKQRDAEKAWIDAQRRPADVDEYGGWAKGPKLRASGFFRTAYVAGGREAAWKGAVPGGKWWLVTPSGHLFFSHGIDGVAMPMETTHIGGRDDLFAGLPPAGDPLRVRIRGDGSLGGLLLDGLEAQVWGGLAGEVCRRGRAEDGRVGVQHPRELVGAGGLRASQGAVHRADRVRVVRLSPEAEVLPDGRAGRSGRRLR
jgi:hypothetical protein